MPVALRGAKQKETPKRVAFFSLEMRGDQLVQRMLCTEAEYKLHIKYSAPDFPTPNTKFLFVIVPFLNSFNNSLHHNKI